MCVCVGRGGGGCVYGVGGVAAVFMGGGGAN